MPATKEVVSDAVLGGAWINHHLRQVSRTEVDRSIPGNIGNSVRSKPAPYPFLIGSVTTSPSCDLSRSLQVAKKRQSTSPAVVRNAWKLGAVVDVNLRNDQDAASIFSKVIMYKLYNSSSNGLYSGFSIKFPSDVVQTKSPQFVDLGLLSIKTFNESSVFGTTSNTIRRQTDVSHWSAPDSIFG